MGSTVTRLRGSRTHGGGSHKNRRGAGNRGGRGNAGRSKHEFHNLPDLGKHGFSRPDALKQDVVAVSLRQIAEHAFEQSIFGEQVTEVDARNLVYENADVVKILGTGQLKKPLTIIADEFSESAVKTIESNGGAIVRKGEEEDQEHIGYSISAGEANISEETVSEVVNQEWEPVKAQETLEHLYISISKQLDSVVSHSGVRESTPQQRLVYSLMLAALFLPVVDRPVGYITVTGVIYAILSDMSKYNG